MSDIDPPGADYADRTIGGVTYIVVKEHSALPGSGTSPEMPLSDLVALQVGADGEGEVVSLHLPVGERPAEITAAVLLDGWIIRVHGLAHQPMPDDSPYAPILRLLGEVDTEQALCDWCHENAVRIFVERLGLGEVL